ncbi:hypothetical protein L873DRAFT_1808670 [Choiromyces venosus 120613-1]|uniref:Uncharacterized protein n=1 Tax=Choiromyces venosus 120613-1 TaxID=1336337 RepID=A0A3N4JNU2_9PEZI|nr:hypothetical protein L873DRAFT_1808670 [Choiromyces venosus 120613-1]
MKFTTAKKLRQEKSAMASGQWDGRPQEYEGSERSGSFSLRRNLRIGGGQASSGMESRQELFGLVGSLDYRLG